MEPQPTNTHWATRVGYGLAGLLFLYVFGVGPAGYVHRRYPKMRPALEAIYSPLRALEGTPLARPIGIYADWWEDLARKRGNAVP